LPPRQVSIPLPMTHDDNASTSSCPVAVWLCMRNARWSNQLPSFLFVVYLKNSRCTKKEKHAMKWITREHVKVDRVACPWLSIKCIDKDAEFLFVPTDQVLEVAEREGATPYDVKNVELGHHGKECSFEAILKKYNLTGDPALVLLGKIVNGADTDNTLWHQPEGEGLEAIAEGFRHLGFQDDHEQHAAEWIVYDALYAYGHRCPDHGVPGRRYGRNLRDRPLRRYLGTASRAGAARAAHGRDRHHLWAGDEVSRAAGGGVLRHARHFSLGDCSLSAH